MDVSRLLPGPYCTYLLASLGARVIKVERPGDGDYLRTMGETLDGVAVLWTAINRGKQSVALDLGRPRDREAFIEMVIDEADVLVESFRPGVLERFGVSLDELLDRRPDLVVASITGYGQHGPHAARAGHDLNILAESGILDDLRDETGRPIPPKVPLADLVAGLTAATGVLALLHQARTSGRGGHLDTSLLDAVGLLPRASMTRALADNPTAIEGSDPGGGDNPFYNIYDLRGGHVAVAAVEPKFQEQLLDALGIAARGRGPALAQVLERRFAALTGAELEELLDGHECCTSVVRTPDEFLAAAEQEERGVVHRVGGTVAAVGSPFVIDGTRQIEVRPAPRLGEHTSELLGGSGVTKMSS